MEHEAILQFKHLYAYRLAIIYSVPFASEVLHLDTDQTDDDSKENEGDTRQGVDHNQEVFGGLANCACRDRRHWPHCAQVLSRLTASASVVVV